MGEGVTEQVEIRERHRGDSWTARVQLDTNLGRPGADDGRRRGAVAQVGDVGGLGDAFDEGQGGLVRSNRAGHAVSLPSGKCRLRVREGGILAA